MDLFSRSNKALQLKLHFIKINQFLCVLFLFLKTSTYFFTEAPSVKILVDSSVCFGSTTTIKSEVSSTPKPNKIEWQKSKDGIDFQCIETPLYFRSTDIFTSPSYVIPKTTFTDKRYYRLLVWNEIGESVSNTVYLNVTGSMALI